MNVTMPEPTLETIADLRRLARQHIETDREPIAVEILEAYTRFRSEDGEAWYWFGIALQRIGRFKDCIEALNRSLQHRPDDPYVLGRLGTAFAETGRHLEAESYFTKASFGAPDVTWIWIEWAESLIKQERFLEAREKVEMALKDPQASTYTLLGDILVALREYPQAEVAYRESLTLDPNFERAQEGIDSLLGMRDVIDGIAHFPCAFQPQRDDECQP